MNIFLWNIGEPKRPQTKVTPFHQTSNVGDKAEFFCESESDVTWTFNDTKLPPNVKETKISEKVDKITISNVEPSNEGTYSCQVNVPSKHSIKDHGTLSVKGINIYIY